jgi:HEAT repeat protein
MQARLLLVLVVLTPVQAFADGLPPIKSVADATTELALTDEHQLQIALTNLKAACKGSELRRELRDNEAIAKRLDQLLHSASAQLERSVLEVAGCLAPARQASLIATALHDADPSVISAAAEAAGHTTDPTLLKAVLELQKTWAAKCLGSPTASEVEACVWLSYAPGPLSSGSDAATREQAAAQAVAMFDSKLPKVREVSVEALAKTQLKKFAPDLKKLVAKEKAGGFESKNSPEIVKRFEAHLKDLKN